MTDLIALPALMSKKRNSSKHAGNKPEVEVKAQLFKSGIISETYFSAVTRAIKVMSYFPPHH